MIVTFTCACGVTETYEKTGGRRKLRCGACRVEAARQRARDWAQANQQRHRENGRQWRERNRAKQQKSAREWAARNRERGNAHWHAYRARKLAAHVEHVDRDLVFVLADGVCGICGTSADPWSFHVDHIVPLSKGGAHSYANTQPAHPACNWRKNAGVLP